MRVERFRNLHREEGFGLIEEEAAVAVGARDKRGAGVGGEGQRAVFYSFGAGQEFVEGGGVEAVEDEDLGAAEQRGVQFEARVLGRGTDQSDRAVLDKGQKAVLLRAVEAVDFVHEEECTLTERRGVTGGSEDALEVGDA